MSTESPSQVDIERISAWNFLVIKATCVCSYADNSAVPPLVNRYYFVYRIFFYNNNQLLHRVLIWDTPVAAESMVGDGEKE